MFSDVLLKGDFNSVFNGAMSGMSIVNGLNKDGLPLGDLLTLKGGSLLFNKMQHNQFPQVKHLGNELCKQLM